LPKVGNHCVWHWGSWCTLNRIVPIESLVGRCVKRWVSISPNTLMRRLLVASIHTVMVQHIAVQCLRQLSIIGRCLVFTGETSQAPTHHVKAKTLALKSASLSAADCSSNIFGQLISCIDRAASIPGASRGKCCKTVRNNLLSPLLKDPVACSQGRTTISRARKWAWSTKRGSLIVPLKCSKSSGDMSTIRFQSSV
jgi:hypothetical protein